MEKDNIRDYADKASNLLPPRIKGRSIFNESGELVKSFEANGVEYKILEFEEAMTIGRLHAWTMLSKSFASGYTAKEDYEYFKELNNLISDAFTSGIATHIGAIMSQLQSRIKSYESGVITGYPFALYLCTLLIVEEGEDLSKWSFDSAFSKIKNWELGGFSSLPFIHCAQLFTPDLLQIKESLRNGLTMEELKTMLGILS